MRSKILELTRRSALTLLGASAASTAMPRSVHAFYKCVSSDIWISEVLDGLAASLWQPLGPQDRDGVLYVMVAPWCPICRRLIQDAEAGLVPVSLRGMPGEAMSAFDQLRVADVLLGDPQGRWSRFIDRSGRPRVSNVVSRVAPLINEHQLRMALSLKSLYNELLGNQDPLGVPTLAGLGATRDGENFALIHSGYGPETFETLRPYIDNNWNDGRTNSLERMMAFQPRKGDEFLISPTSPNSRIRIAPHPLAMPYLCPVAGLEYKAYQEHVVENGETWFVLHLSDGHHVFAKAGDFQRV